MGVTHTLHAAKEAVLFNFYSSLLGRRVLTNWDFSLEELYPSQAVNDRALSTLFTIDEVSTALFAMDTNSSLGPDGFGPAFYHAFWNLTKQGLFSFADSFTTEHGCFAVFRGAQIWSLCQVSWS